MRGGVELFRKANSAILMLLLLFYMRMVFRKPNGVKLYFNDYFFVFSLSHRQRLSRDVPDGMEYLGYESERRPFSGYYYSPTLIHSPQHPHHQSLHSPTNNMSSSYSHQPYPPQQKQHQPLPVSIKRDYDFYIAKNPVSNY